MLALDVRPQFGKRQVIVLLEQHLHELASLIVQSWRPATGVWQSVCRAGLALAADEVTDGSRRNAEQLGDLLLRVVVVFIGRNDLAAQIVGVGLHSSYSARFAW